MKFDIDWDTVDAIGTEFVKQTPMRDSTGDTFSGHDPDNADHQADAYER